MKKITKIPDWLEIDFYNGFIYNKKAFAKFIDRNNIFIIPDEFFKVHGERIDNQYKDRTIGEFYNFDDFKNKEICSRYRHVNNVSSGINLRPRRTIRFGRRISWNNEKTIFYVNFNLDELLDSPEEINQDAIELLKKIEQFIENPKNSVGANSQFQLEIKALLAKVK